MNDQSSRSHAIFTITLEQVSRDTGVPVKLLSLEERGLERPRTLGGWVTSLRVGDPLDVGWHNFVDDWGFARWNPYWRIELPSGIYSPFGRHYIDHVDFRLITMQPGDFTVGAAIKSRETQYCGVAILPSIKGFDRALWGQVKGEVREALKGPWGAGKYDKIVNRDSADRIVHLVNAKEPQSSMLVHRGVDFLKSLLWARYRDICQKGLG